jgi:hypothetical protein
VPPKGREGDTIVAGLAPDGVSRVTAVGAGSQEPGSLASNVYVAKGRSLRTVELSSPSSTQQVDVPGL